jgi:hypothetical protein
MKAKTIEDLNEIYTNAESEDKEVYAEMRSNIQLVAGEHYSKKNLDKYFNRMRTANIPESTKLRLTKNHIQKIAAHYEEAIMSLSPGVKIVPQLDSELQDQKDAELNSSVWEFVKSKHKLKDKIRSLCQDYVQIGECAVKIFWDPNKGDFVGYAQKVDEEGNPLFDEMGQPAADESQPVFSGDIEFERIFGFNIFRAQGSKTMDESEFIGYRKMADVKDLKAIYADDPDKLKYIQESSKEEFVVFDTAKSSYSRTKNQVLIKEFYYKPCITYPEGYFYITTEAGILEEGPLPFGIFPIVWRGFDTYPTRARGYSKIKVARPYQAEINRAASQQATHQVTLADDKIIYQAGTKLAPGALLPGVRGVTYQGQAPTILPGRTGEQFTAHIADNIAEMYQVVMLDELAEENTTQTQTDPWANLYKNIRQKKKFAKYGEGFEFFLQDMCETGLTVLKHYLPDETLIQMVGRKEIVNIPEFKKTSKLCYQIKLEAVEDSLETQMGKQLSAVHIMQYVGKQLPEEAVGKIIRELPFGNFESAFEEFTIDSDNVKNDMLALERGEQLMFSDSDNHAYYAKVLSARMKKADFKYLDPMVQQNYEQKVQMHLEADAKQQEAILAAKNEQIPTTGPMVGVDLYVENKDDPSKPPKRARLPTSSVEWLVHQMEAQGQTMEKLEKYNQDNLAKISEMLLSSSGQGNAPQGGMNGPSPGDINGGGQPQY